jgi:hypothetical protein
MVISSPKGNLGHQIAMVLIGNLQNLIGIHGSEPFGLMFETNYQAGC